MSFLSPLHIAFFGAIALLVLGPKRFPEFTRTLGNGLRELRDVMSAATVTAEPPRAVAASGDDGSAEASAAEPPAA
jgi:Sec-independent protein translocase protein TatA